jgi:hypothetical protein
VRMKRSCFRSGRWSLLCPQVIAGVGFPRRAVSSAASSYEPRKVTVVESLCSSSISTSNSRRAWAQDPVGRRRTERPVRRCLRGVRGRPGGSRANGGVRWWWGSWCGDPGAAGGGEERVEPGSAADGEDGPLRFGRDTLMVLVAGRRQVEDALSFSSRKGTTFAARGAHR